MGRDDLNKFLSSFFFFFFSFFQALFAVLSPLAVGSFPDPSVAAATHWSYGVRTSPSAIGNPDFYMSDMAAPISSTQSKNGLAFGPVNGVQGWYGSTLCGYTPIVMVNTGPSQPPYTAGSDSPDAIATNDLFIHPPGSSSNTGGCNGPNQINGGITVVEWTAPYSGRIDTGSLSARFEAIQNGANAKDVTAQIYVNSLQLWAQVVTNGSSQTYSNGADIIFALGDIISFQVAQTGGQGDSQSTGLRVSFTFTPSGGNE